MRLQTINVNVSTLTSTESHAAEFEIEYFQFFQANHMPGQISRGLQNVYAAFDPSLHLHLTLIIAFYSLKLEVLNAGIGSDNT